MQLFYYWSKRKLDCPFTYQLVGTNGGIMELLCYHLESWTWEKKKRVQFQSSSHENTSSVLLLFSKTVQST